MLHRNGVARPLGPFPPHVECIFGGHRLEYASTDSGNTRRHFRTQNRLSLDAEAGPRRDNPCPRVHHPGACANHGLQCDGPNPYRVSCCPSFGPSPPAPCVPSCHCRVAPSNRGRVACLQRVACLARETAPIAGACARVAREQSVVGWEWFCWERGGSPYFGRMRELGLRTTIRSLLLQETAWPSPSITGF